jgi:hypothetical protein
MNVVAPSATDDPVDFAIGELTNAASVLEVTLTNVDRNGAIVERVVVASVDTALNATIEALIAVPGSSTDPLTIRNVIALVNRALARDELNLLSARLITKSWGEIKARYKDPA